MLLTFSDDVLYVDVQLKIIANVGAQKLKRISGGYWVGVNLDRGLGVLFVSEVSGGFRYFQLEVVVLTPMDCTVQLVNCSEIHCCLRYVRLLLCRLHI